MIRLAETSRSQARRSHFSGATPFDDPNESKADMVDGAIGELSSFHESFGFYAQGVSVHTAVLPDGWRERVVRWSNNSTGRARAAFLEPHDCVVSKLVAFREKDRAFAAALLRRDSSMSLRCTNASIGSRPIWTQTYRPGCTHGSTHYK
jgi:hypothetical protein